MGALFGIIVAIVLAVLGLVTGFIWTFPFAGLALVIGLGYMAMQRKGAGSPIAVESGRKQEPTGTPRSSTAGTETANARVESGQGGV